MFVLVDKPQWWTSHDIVEKIRRVYGDEKVGHGGTLDPMATWLLVVAVGKDTKQLGKLLGATKSYTTTIDFSVSTDTRDMDYRKEYTQWPIESNNQTIQVAGMRRSFPSRAEIEAKLQSIQGTHLLPLTPFSAKKIDGKKLYAYAREGTPIFMDVPMSVLRYKIVELSFPKVTLELTVWSGTYIRSIGYRLGRSFGLWGTLCVLRRTSVDGLHVPV